MSVDAKILGAIREAVRRSGQPATVGDRLVAWFEGLATGNESLEDPDSLDRHLELLFQATQVDQSEAEGDEE